VIPLDQQGVEAGLGGPISVAHDRDGVLQSQHVADTLKPSGCPIVQASDPAAIDRAHRDGSDLYSGNDDIDTEDGLSVHLLRRVEAFDRLADELPLASALQRHVCRRRPCRRVSGEFAIA
jgi:hypothetical protein